MLLLCCLFASRVETYNIQLFFMFRIKTFEVYKGYQDSNKKISKNFLMLLGIKYLKIGGVKDHSKEQKKQANLKLG